MNKSSPLSSFPIDSSWGASTIFLTSTCGVLDVVDAIGDSGDGEGFQKVDVLERR